MTKEQRVTLWVLMLFILIFLVPLFTAWLLYKHPQWLPKKTTNHGFLIPTAFKIDEFYANKNKNQFPNQHKWSLLFVPEIPCKKACQNTLFYLNQIQKALGKNRDRVQIVLLLLNQNSKTPDFLSIKNQYGSIMTNPKQFSKLIETKIKTSHAKESNSVFIVDPLNNVILFYEPSANPKYILEDLSHLLSISKIG